MMFRIMLGFIQGDFEVFVWYFNGDIFRFESYLSEDDICSYKIMGKIIEERKVVKE